MTVYQEMEVVRNFVAENFGEEKVTKLKYKKINQRYHNEHHYSFTLSTKSTPLYITLITGYEPHYNEAIYELIVSQDNGDKLKSSMVKLSKETATSSNIISTLQNKFKMPLKK